MALPLSSSVTVRLLERYSTSCTRLTFVFVFFFPSCSSTSSSRRFSVWWRDLKDPTYFFLLPPSSLRCFFFRLLAAAVAAAALRSESSCCCFSSSFPSPLNSFLSRESSSVLSFLWRIFFFLPLASKSWTTKRSTRTRVKRRRSPYSSPFPSTNCLHPLPIRVQLRLLKIDVFQRTPLCSTSKTISSLSFRFLASIVSIK